MNIERFLIDCRGQNIIQGSVSLDDGTVERGCAEIVPGFHRRIAVWRDGVVKHAGTRLVSLRSPAR